MNTLDPLDPSDPFNLLLVAVRRHLIPLGFRVGVRKESITSHKNIMTGIKDVIAFRRYIICHYPPTNMDYVPTYSCDDIEPETNIDDKAEELVIDIIEAFERGEAEQHARRN